MTKADLVEKMAEKGGMAKNNAERVLNAFLVAVEDSLVRDGKLMLTGFGTFSVDTRKARKGRNPRTGEEIEIPESKVIKFRVGKQLKELVK